MLVCGLIAVLPARARRRAGHLGLDPGHGRAIGQGAATASGRAAPDSNPLTRYHLAVALKTLGRTSEARKELHVIIYSNPDLDWMDDVRELLDELSS